MIVRGDVERIDATTLVARLPNVAVGDAARIGLLTAEVRRVEQGRATLAVHGALSGIACGADVAIDLHAGALALGACALGRAIDASGLPLDGGPALRGHRVAVEPACAVARAPVREPFWTGVRCIDGLLALGAGARTGIFGPPGTGKSTLLEAVGKAGSADAVVVALVGERGREAQAWMQRCDARMTIVCATSDRPAAERWRAARVAFAQARALRERGLHVLLLLDSLARTAAALREIALACGEPPGRGGYPPSVFAEMARLLEIAGATAQGTITLVATVLDDGDERDAVSDAARSLLDGHLQLSGALASAGRFPAIDVPVSTSRTMNDVVARAHAEAAQIVRAAICALARTADARSLGIAANGAPLQAAVACEEAIDAFLQQREPSDPCESVEHLCTLASQLDIAAGGHTAIIRR